MSEEVWGLTCVKCSLKGSPLSRAKAHTNRETEATTLKFEILQILTIMMTMIVEAAFEPVLTNVSDIDDHGKTEAYAE